MHNGDVSIEINGSKCFVYYPHYAFFLTSALGLQFNAKKKKKHLLKIDGLGNFDDRFTPPGEGFARGTTRQPGVREADTRLRLLSRKCCDPEETQLP